MRGRRLVVALMLSAAVVLASCGGESVDPTTRSAVTVSIEIQSGAPVGGVKKITVSRGDSVTVAVTGDSNDVIHIHGYDLRVEPTDGSGATTFDALIPGVFEIELESSARKLVQLTVS